MARNDDTSLRAPDAILRRQAEDLRELLLAVPGTKDVDIFGDSEEEIVVEIDPPRLAAVGMTAGQVSQLVSRSDATSFCRAVARIANGTSD